MPVVSPIMHLLEQPYLYTTIGMVSSYARVGDGIMDHRPSPAQFGSRLGDRLSFWRGSKLVHQGLFIARGLLLQIAALLIKHRFIDIK